MLSQRLKGARIAPAATAVSVVSSRAGTSIVGGVTSVTFTGHAIGDMLVAVGGNRATAESTYTAGWTRINGTGASSRSLVVVYFIANTTSNITVTFTGTGDSSFVYSNGITFRNTSGIGASAIYTAATQSISVPYSALTLNKTNGTSAVGVFTFVGLVTGITTPPSWVLTNGGTNSSGGYAVGATSNVAAGAITSSNAATVHISVIFEILA